MSDHKYTSTACQHELHDRCRETCKFCDAPCACDCHRRATPGNVYPLPSVWINPGRQGGEPCIAGTRVPVGFVAHLVNDGIPPRRVKDFYPSVSAKAAREATAWFWLNRKGKR